MLGLTIPLVSLGAWRDRGPDTAASGSCGPVARVLLVGDVLAPGDRAAGLVVLLHGEVSHEAVRGGAVPVVLARLEENAVAGADLLDRPGLALAQADALGDEDRLPVRVGVPGGAGARGEVHERGGERGGRLGGGDDVDVDVAGEPVGGAFLSVDAAAGDLHVVLHRVGDQAAVRTRVSASVAVSSDVGGSSSTPGVAAARRGRATSVTSSASTRKAVAAVSAAETRWASSSCGPSPATPAASKTVTRMPSPSAPPRWCATLTRPPATPASCAATPAMPPVVSALSPRP